LLRDPPVEAFDFRACAFKGSYPALSAPNFVATIRRSHHGIGEFTMARAISRLAPHP